MRAKTGHAGQCIPNDPSRRARVIGCETGGVSFLGPGCHAMSLLEGASRDSVGCIPEVIYRQGPPFGLTVFPVGPLSYPTSDQSHFSDFSLCHVRQTLAPVGYESIW
jgi:hypothetical protein